MRNWTEDQMTLVMIRHGATRANIERRYLGKTDEVLSKEGERELLWERGLGLFPDIDVLFTSPMRRCVQTAEILYPGLRSVQVKEWVEMDFGEFEGKNYMELKGDERYQAWVDSDGMLPFPGGEGREAFVLRCDKGFRKMLQEVRQMKTEREERQKGISRLLAHPQASQMKTKREERRKIIGMIVHGGTIMALLSKYGEGDYFDYQVANGRGYVCTVKTYGNRIEIGEIKRI